MNFPDDMTIADARSEMRSLVKDGHRCPVCDQFAKIYKRRVNSSMARDLISMFRAAGTNFAYLPDVRKRAGSRGNREESKLRYWGLVVEEPTLRPDGGRAGWWRVTEAGAAWVLERTTIPQYAFLYDGVCLALRGTPVTIRDALGARFDYGELMSG